MNLDELGRAVASWRREHQISQTKMCELSGLSRATLSLLERGALGELGYNKVQRLLCVLDRKLIVTHNSPVPTLDDLLRERQEEYENPGPSGMGGF